MSDKYFIKNADIVNEGEIFRGSVLIENGKIKTILKGEIPFNFFKDDYKIIDATGKYLLPGVIDDHVHFREPGLTHKADIYSESKAAVAGGVTSYMEMPNTIPNAISINILEEKYKIAAEKSLANFSFYLGAANENINEILKINPSEVCGVKVFIGSSTGNMLVNDFTSLEKIFSESKILIAVHCEDEEVIKKNTEFYKNKFGENIPFEYHSKIRSEEACYKSTSFAIQLAKKFNTRLHILHLSTWNELELLDNNVKTGQKKITSELCVNHLWFNERDYKEYGGKIKINPSIKTSKDQEELFNALLNNKIDLVATDHAPHTLEEKNNTYFKCPSGAPMIQHSLVAMLEFYHQQKISLEKIVEKMCHAPAECFQIEKRGFVKEGFYADLSIVDLHSPWRVNGSNILHKCGWSSMDGQTFKSKVLNTFVNGRMVYNNGIFDESVKGMRILFKR